MKTVLVMLALVVIVGVGLGYFRGWFGFSADRDEGKSNVTLSVDSDKIEADKDAAVGKAQEMGHKATDAISPKTTKAQE